MDNIEAGNVVIIPCPPLREYKEQPHDQSLCTAEPCPFCNNNMWLSEKKKFYIRVAPTMGKEVLLGCYDCIKKQILTDEKIKNIFIRAHHEKI